MKRLILALALLCCLPALAEPNCEKLWSEVVDHHELAARYDRLCYSKEITVLGDQCEALHLTLKDEPEILAAIRKHKDKEVCAWKAALDAYNKQMATIE